MIRTALLVTAIALAFCALWIGIAPAQSGPVEITIPAGVTTANFDKRLQPKLVCHAAHCSVKVTARLGTADVRLFHITAKGGVIGRTFEPTDLEQDQSDEVSLFNSFNDPDWEPLENGSRFLRTKPRVEITIVAEIESFDAANPDGVKSTLTVPVSLAWPAPKAPTGHGHAGVIKRITVPAHVSLRAHRVKVHVELAASVHYGILQSAMLGPGGSRGFIGKFGVSHGGGYDIPMIMSKERDLVRRTKPYVPTAGEVLISYASLEHGRDDQGGRGFTYTR
jgi:hypothetical protein